ncbi:hypothetical protein [Pseudomonas sp. MWU12-2029]|uniref:hypothetical protein n=1 Tax=Pseudomonas sp. MWU12-2029 TaxID=2927805 RepID=UPI0020100B7F|nr:hypothetical protein [Pseudomonas sp. MWU12-2029]
MADEYSLSDVLERMYVNQLALKAALMELTLNAEEQGLSRLGENVRGALWAIGENAGHIKQGLARLKEKRPIRVESGTVTYNL